MVASAVAVAKAMDNAGPRDAAPKPATGPWATEQGEPEEEATIDPITYPAGITESMVIQTAMARRKSFDNFAKQPFQEITETYRHFKCLPLGSHTSNKTSTNVPIVNPIIETDTAKRITSMFSKSKVVDAVPEDPNMDGDPSNENKQDIDDLINQQILASPARIPSKCYDAFKAMAIEGITVWKAFWDTEECWHRKPEMKTDPASGMQFQTGLTETMYQKGFPNAESRAIQNLVWDYRCGTRICDSPYIGDFSYMTKNELLVLEQKGIIKNVDKAIRKNAPMSEDNDKDKEAKRRKELGEAPGSNKTDENQGAYEIGEWHAEMTWEKLQPDGSKVWTSEEFRFWICNNETVLRFEENPLQPKRKPYVSARHTIDPKRLIGLSATHAIKGLQLHASGLQASLQDLIKKAAQSPTFYTKGSGLDLRKNLLTENSMIAVSDASKIQHFPVDVAAIKVTSEEKQATIALARETVPANEQMQGIQGDVQQTATGESLDAQGANIRLQAIADLSGYEFFAPLAQEFYLLDQQFASNTDLTIRQSSVDGAPRQLTQNDLTNKYLFEPVTSSSQMNKQNQAANIEKMLSQIMEAQAKSPSFFIDKDGNQNQFDSVEFYIKEYMPLAGVRNGRTYWKKSPPPPPVPQQAPPVLDVPGKMWYEAPVPGQPPSGGAAPVLAPVPAGSAPVLGAGSAPSPPTPMAHPGPIPQPQGVQ